MNSPVLREVSLDDKYTQQEGAIYLSGTQALARLPMLQKQRDRRAGLHTAGYISGYRGSPLGGLDLALWKAQKQLTEHEVVFQPGLNEDLAATAVWGTQQVNLYDHARYQGVFGMWYGKGPGVDRSADVLKHANAAGTSRFGGVLLLAGDDHAAKSSSVAHQSEHILIACGIPVLYPADIQEYLDFGLHGWAMSRHCGLWVAMKCVTDVVESSASVALDAQRLQIVLPAAEELPAGGLNIRWPDPPLAQEARMLDDKWYAALAYIRANKLNRIVIDSPVARFGIMAAGKAYLDLRQALADLGLDEQACAAIGIRVFKVGCVWPLEAQGAREFATGLEEILVVEEKRQILEYALKEELYNWRDDVRPRVYGKFDERDEAGGGEWSVPRGKWLLPARNELSPALIAKAIAGRLERIGMPEHIAVGVRARIALIVAKEREAARPRLTVERQPWFCSGCPHNTSTKVPQGSRALAGIGCHYMAMWMDRNTETPTQMGGEGASWLGQMHFSGDRHVFVNLGDGTYFHSGLLAIRAAIAAKANVTYKILFNDAVAMTGGQPVDGELTVPRIARQVQAEGASRIVVVTDAPEKYAGGRRDSIALPSGVSVFHRDRLDAVQRQLRDTAGATVLIYDQTCATEKRRRRKRGAYPDAQRRVFINDAVCEGCGDCSAASNCLSVEPLETPLGTKRRVNQSSCNTDFSCLNGFCPSFVTAEGAQLKQPAGRQQSPVPSSMNMPDFDRLPVPRLPALERPFGIVVTGVGGTGVVTIGALLGMAAHLENKGVTVLDMTGLAQKGGAVLSHVQIANSPQQIHATRISTGEAQLLLGCDAIVSASGEALSKMRFGVTQAVINSADTPTAEMIGNPNWTFPAATVAQDIRSSIGEACAFIDASALAVMLLGDALYANLLLLGFAWQKGWIPLSRAALLRAIELNGVAVEKNRLAFEWGRVAAFDRAALSAGAMAAIPVQTPESLDVIVRRRVEFLAAYQNVAYGQRYKAAIDQLRKAEQKIVISGPLALTEAAARNLAKLMAYKDEYEVARLHSDPAFLDKLRAQFEGEPGRDYRLNFYLAPPLLSRRDTDGHFIKRRYGAWMLVAFGMLAKLKGLRGTWLDPFGYTQERVAERRLVADYLTLIEQLCASLDAARLPLAMQLAQLPEQIRGYGHVKERNRVVGAARRAELLNAYLNGTAIAA